MLVFLHVLIQLEAILNMEIQFQEIVQLAILHVLLVMVEIATTVSLALQEII